MSIEVRQSYREFLARRHGEEFSSVHAFANANQAIENAITKTRLGQFDDIDPSAIETAIKTSQEVALDNSDTTTFARSRLLDAYLPFLLYSEAINTGTVQTRGEVNRVKQTLDFDGLYDELIGISSEVLEAYDQAVSATSKQLADVDKLQQRDGLKGLAQELTFLTLAARHRTPKQYAVPALMYEDQLAPVQGMHIDAKFYDNRRSRSLKYCGVQVKSRRQDTWYYDYSVVVVDGQDLGNDFNSRSWPNRQGTDFITLRALVDEKTSATDRKTNRPIIDKIHGRVLRKVAGNPYAK